jgi:ADP-heptose:LPS heptosyltransferase
MIGALPLIRIDGGIGDMLLLTVITRKIFNDTGRKVNLFSQYPQIFENNPSVNHVYSEEGLSYKARKFFRRNFKDITYRCWTNLLPGKANIFKAHVVEQFCHQLGLKGHVALKPDLVFDPDEIDSFEKKMITNPYVIVQSQASNSNHPQTTKNWGVNNIQEVVNFLGKNHTVIQLGSPKDARFQGVSNHCGKTTIRESGLLLKNAAIFIGLEGALMHMARAVDCPSVIVWGGRLKPSQIGYSCFENITVDMPCSPCWIPNACPHDLACMKEIKPTQVIEACEKILSQKKTELPVDKIEILESISPRQMKNEIADFPPHLDHLILWN